MPTQCGAKSPVGIVAALHRENNVCWRSKIVPLGTPQDLQDLLPLTTPDAADAGEDADGFDVVHARAAEIAG